MLATERNSLIKGMKTPLSVKIESMSKIILFILQNVTLIGERSVLKVSQGLGKNYSLVQYVNYGGNDRLIGCNGF